MFFSLKIFNIQHFLQTRYVVVAHCYSQVLAVGINLLAPVSNLPNHIPVNNREMFLLAIPSDRNLKIHILSNAFSNPSVHFFLFDLYLFDFLPISRSRNSKAALPSQWRPLLASISFRYYHPTFPPLIYS